MRRCSRLLALLLALPLGGHAQNFDFKAPTSAENPEAAARLRDLAQRVLPIYQESDPLRYLARLSALQTVAGSYAAADESRRSLRDRRRNLDPVRPTEGATTEADLLDIYTHARALEAAGRIGLPQAFASAFHQNLAALDDRQAYAAISRPPPLPGALARDLTQSLDQARANGALPLSEAVQLVWRYFLVEAWSQMTPLLPPLEAEEAQRRFAIERDVPIRIADGAPVFATVVRPKSARKPLPTLLEFALDTPSPGQSLHSAAHGYIGILASSRRLPKDPATGGPFLRAGDDARTVIRWIARQPWSDGRVAMLGERYSGFAAWAAARHLPRALKAIATYDPMAPGIDFPMRGNIFHPAAYRWILNRASRPAPSAAGDAPLLDESQWRALDEAWYRSGTACGTLDTLYGKPNATYHRWLDHPSYDGFWQRMIPFQQQFAAINVPVLTMAGYFDEGATGALYYFTQHQHHDPRADHALLLGPFDRSALAQGPEASVGGIARDPAAQIDLRELRYQWLDHVLKGAPRPALLKDRVNFEVMQADRWRHVPALSAPAGAAALRLYLGGDAGHGHLAQQRDPHWDDFLRQTVNLADRSNASRTPAAALVTRDPSTRDALMFTGEPLQQALEVSGTISGELDFMPNKMDVDLNLTLYELQPNGDYVPLFDPPIELRASYARDRVHRHPLRAGERQHLAFGSERFVSRKLSAGSRLVAVLGVNRRPDREVNFGSGKDVREESAGVDGIEPLRLRWFRGTHIDLPVITSVMKPPRMGANDGRH